jgi:hypothetical protein
MKAKGYYLINNVDVIRKYVINQTGLVKITFFAPVPLFQKTYGGGSAFRFRLEIFR